MKNNFTKILISSLIAAILVVSGYSQRGGSFGGGSRSFGGGSSSFSSGRSSSSYSGTSSFGRSGGFGGNRTTSSSSYSRPSTSYSRPSYSTSFRSNYRVGYRVPVGTRYYGNPYFYGGHSLYWYGGGYFSYYPGSPLILGNPGMPGYGASYGYSPGMSGGYYVNPLWYILGIVIIGGVIIVCVRAANS